MTKSELIERLAQAEGITVKAAEVAVNTVLSSMEEALVEGDRIEIRGLGSFKIKLYGEYKGRNPKTGEFIRVKPKKMPFFKPGKELKDRLNAPENVKLTSVAPIAGDGPDSQQVAKG